MIEMGMRQKHVRIDGFALIERATQIASARSGIQYDQVLPAANFKA